MEWERTMLAIMGLTGLRDSHMCVLAYSRGFALTGVSFREQPSVLYEISGVPCKFSFSTGFSY